MLVVYLVGCGSRSICSGSRVVLLPIIVVLESRCTMIFPSSLPCTPKRPKTSTYITHTCYIVSTIPIFTPSPSPLSFSPPLTHSLSLPCHSTQDQVHQVLVTSVVQSCHPAYITTSYQIQAVVVGSLSNQDGQTTVSTTRSITLFVM